MKRVLFCLAVCVLVGVQFGFAQNTGMRQFLDELSDGTYSDILEGMNVSSDISAPSQSGNITLIFYVLKDDCNVERKRELEERIAALKEDPEYPLLMQAKKENRLVSAYMKMDESALTSDGVVFGKTDDDVDMIVRITGSFSESDMAELFNTLSI